MKHMSIVLTGIAVLFLTGAGDEYNPEKKVSPDSIRYIALFAEDMEKMTAFFTEDLGFTARGGSDFVIYEIGTGQYFALVPRREELGDPGRIVVGFQVEEIDDYFKQITEKGIQAIDPMQENQRLERPVFRQWGAREFGVRTPEGDLLVFTRMPSD